jgi:nucleoside transporter
MTLGMRSRLSVMMFLEYFIWGAWYVTLSTWLSVGLHFTGEQIGIAAGATAVGAMIAPFFVGLIADQAFAAERVLACLHMLGSALLFAASAGHTFAAVYVPILLYCLCFMPTLALTNSLAFRQMRDPKLEFGPIRVLGTAGWIVAGLLVGSLHMESSAWAVRVAAIASLVMAAYCLTLPHTPPLATQQTGGALSRIFPRASVRLLRERSMAVFALASLLICIPLQFYYAFTNLFLNEVGVHDAAGKMTGGQLSELLCMLLIPWFFRRLGVKYMLVAGMVAWVVRYALFAYGAPGSRMWMLWGGIIVHGICYDFFFVTGQIYIDRRSSPALRAATQGLITFLTYGAGMFIGSWLSGAVVEHFTLATHGGMTAHAWRPIWLFAASAAAVVLVLFLFTFRDTQEERDPIHASTKEAASANPVELPV